ncbi:MULTISPECIES: DUF2975 domain-containing protein [unclassified Streptomyces]|uniref:DUF2975 domain-containing protein n=1 Tax=unclassified Streptomyces TaxID=2593676 RepID=UPI0035E37564
MSAEVQSSNGVELPDEPPSHGVHAEARLLEPVATVVRGVYRLLLVSLVVGAVGPLVGTKLRLMWGGPNVCAESRSDFGTDGFTGRFRPHAGVEVMTSPSYCTDHADGAQRLFDFLGVFPSWLLVLGILFLLNRLIQGASREGVFTARTAKHLRIAGWWLLLGCLVAEVVEAGARAALLATLAKDYTFTAGSWLGTWQPPYALVFTALGILTFARIMRAGVAMREDLEGTV